MSAGLLAAGGALAGGLLNLLKAKKAQSEAKKDYLLASEVARYSPWTKMNAGQYVPKGGIPSATNAVLGGLLQGGLTGYMQGQNIQNIDLQNKLLGSLSNSSSSPWSLMALQGDYADRPRGNYSMYPSPSGS